MGKKKILIVDDDPSLRRGLNMRFIACNYEAVHAVDAATALNVVQKERPDLIVLGIGLPGGDGYTLIERLKEIESLASIPVILLSARQPLPSRRPALEAGAAALIPESGPSHRLWRTIHQGCARRRTAAARKKILVVDDDPDLRRGLIIRLRANNYDTIHAVDAISAINVAQMERPDLIVLDIGLPDGDGYIVMERLQEIESLASIPVIVLSARNVLVNQGRAVEAGAFAFFQKPADYHELLTTIRKGLRGSNELVSETMDTCH